jgi:hypothetical protein
VLETTKDWRKATAARLWQQRAVREQKDRAYQLQKHAARLAAGHGGYASQACGREKKKVLALLRGGRPFSPARIVKHGAARPAKGHPQMPAVVSVARQLPASHRKYYYFDSKKCFMDARKLPKKST